MCCAIVSISTHLLTSQKVRSLAIHVQNSPLRRDRLREACAAASLPDLALVRPVKTRWNSSAECILRTLELRKAVHALTGSDAFEQFQLSPLEWRLMEQTQNIMMVS